MNSKTVFIFLLIFLTIPVVYAESYGSGSYGSGSYGSEETVADSGNGGSSGHQLSNIVPSAPSSEGRAPARPSRRSPTPKESVLFDVMGKIIETDELLKQGTQEISFGVEYGSDIDKVKELIEKTLKKVPKVMKTNKNKSIQVLFLNMGDSALEFKARFWVKNYGDKFSTKIRATEDIYKALTKSKIGIPFPTRTVYLKKE